MQSNFDEVKVTFFSNSCNFSAPFLRLTNKRTKKRCIKL